MRNWKSISASFATLCARVTQTAGILIINGAASRRMTHDEFGLWTILYSVNLLSNALDFGFSFTLGNRLAALGSRGVEAEEERRETFLSVFYLQAAIAVVCMLLVYVSFPLLPWTRWLKVTDRLLILQVQNLMPVVLMLMVSTLPVVLIWTVFFAYQEIKLASFLIGGYTLLQTAIFLVATYECSFIRVIVIYFASSTILGIFLTCYVFLRRKWRFTLLPPGRILARVRSMARISFHSFFLNLSSVISTILGTLISGHVSGLSAAGDFTLVQKLFSFLITSHLGILAPLAPGITRDSHAGNWDDIRRRLRVAVWQLWPAVFLILGPIIWFAHPLLIRLWAGHPLRLYPLAGLLLLWACMNGFANTFSVFLNSLGLIKMQAAIAFAMIMPSLVLPLLLGRWLGITGIALSMVLCALPVVTILPIYTRRALRLQLHRV